MKNIERTMKKQVDYNINKIKIKLMNEDVKIPKKSS